MTCLRPPFTRFAWTSLLVAVALVLSGPLAAQDDGVLSRARNGTPTFVQGDLGNVGSTTTVDTRFPAGRAFAESVRSFALDFAAERLSATGEEDLAIASSRIDDLGEVHTRFEQSIRGRRVYGASLIVHSNAATGDVHIVNGEFVSSAGLPTTAAVGAGRALRIATELYGLQNFVKMSRAELAYVLTPESSEAHLVWRQLIAYEQDGLEQVDWFYSDALTGAFVTRHPTVHHAKSWRTYDANNGTSLPGSLRCTNEEPCGDAVAQDAHDNAGATWDYYNDRFGRDSLNDNGLTLISTVSYRTNYNNAFWNGSQMVYGDGDGSIFSPLGAALDVVAHELTHGVTDYESDLVYLNESGALNEAWSDIFSAAAEAWIDGGINDDTWKLGEDIYTPGTAGDALRYMDDPTADGQSYDYYPERYTGSADNGGVHLNSGIANLAFVLLVEGGVHPRNKTAVDVQEIGLERAEQIFYRAQTTYLTPSSNFEAARNATAAAAADLYGDPEVASVQQAWCAVGVPGCDVDPPPPPPGGDELENGAPVSGLAGSTGDIQRWTVEIPAGATDLAVTMSGGTGDADLYVRFGAEPSTSTWDCRPYTAGNNETCSFDDPEEGTWHVMVRAYRGFSGVTLQASWTEPGDPPPPPPGDDELENGVPRPGLSGDQASEEHFTLVVPDGADNLRFEISGGTGDADLYVRRGAPPTTSSYDCRPYLNGNDETCTFDTPQAGIWHVMLRGYRSYSGVTLVASYDEPADPPPSCEPDGGSVTGISDGRGGQKRYYIDVPACASQLVVTISGGSGDADLYVRFDAEPTRTSWDCRPWDIGNDEICTFQPTQEGRYHIMIDAYRSYSGVTLEASYE